MVLDKAYNPKDVEDRWYKHWEDSGFFRADEKSSKKPYSIVIPPPNVTGVLTMGHVLNNTIQDILARRKRMEGFEVLWLPGTDHAGIATQTVVEKSLKKEGKIKHREDLGRDEFIKKTWEWKDKHGVIIIQQLKKIGCSCDWSRLVFTMDGLDEREKNPAINYSECVRQIFVKLYEKGLIYRGKRMVNWCPVSHTALSDEEVEMKEVDGHLWYMKYPLSSSFPLAPQSGARRESHTQQSSKEFIVVATTRPETMLGDEAIAVNPKDPRYKDLIGKNVMLPLKNKLIPIIADDVVDLKFGTGAVKVTPAHDVTDYEISLRHNLPITVVIGSDGIMTELAGEKYEGLDRFECRRAVVADIEEYGLLLKVENYRHSVGFSQRADVPIEPFLSEQWFLKYPEQKKGLKAVVKGDIKFWPERWTKVYEHWMENLRDWCISRQLWWGHRIPVWYCQKPVACRSSLVGCKPDDIHHTTDDRRPTTDEPCPPIVTLEPPGKCPKCGCTDLKQDEDVLDTWFSSWLWPFATMGWPNKTATLKKFYPTSDLVTGPDIIFFWVARMIMAGFKFMKKKPFSNVFFTGIIRDSLGRKMSKSLGNSPDPLDLVATYGADGLRFGLMLIAPQGQDILFTQDRMEVGRNFCNKLWNATRFIMINTEGVGSRPTTDNRRPTNFLNPADKWILNRLEHTVSDVNKALDNYEFDSAARMLYQFVWGDFCDWYVELSKVHLYGNNETAKEATIHTLTSVLSTALRLLHPFIPFITEEIWQQIIPSNSIMYAEYPKASKSIPYEKESSQLEVVQKIIDAIRNIRGEHNIKPSEQIETTIIVLTDEDENLVKGHKLYIEKLANIENLIISRNLQKPEDVATAIIGGIEILVPWKGLIDIEAEKTRLTKEIAKIETELEFVKKKLENESFVSKAPPQVVAKERERLTAIDNKLMGLKNALDKLKI